METIFLPRSSSGGIKVLTLSLLKTTSERSIACDINSLYSKKAAQRNIGPTTGHKSITIAFIHVLRFFSFPLKWFQIT